MIHLDDQTELVLQDLINSIGSLLKGDVATINDLQLLVHHMNTAKLELDAEIFRELLRQCKEK